MGLEIFRDIFFSLFARFVFVIRVPLHDTVGSAFYKTYMLD